MSEEELFQIDHILQKGFVMSLVVMQVNGGYLRIRSEPQSPG